jgi:hypothetical protein
MKDEHGEVCPVNREEGGKIFRGDPIAKLDWFAAVDGQYENGKANGTKHAHINSCRGINGHGGWAVPHDTGPYSLNALATKF